MKESNIELVLRLLGIMFVYLCISLIYAQIIIKFGFVEVVLGMLIALTLFLLLLSLKEYL